MGPRSILESFKVWKNVYNRLRYFKRMYPLRTLAKEADRNQPGDAHHRQVALSKQASSAFPPKARALRQKVEILHVRLPST